MKRVSENKVVFENLPVLHLLIKLAALGNKKASFHCTHLHSFFPLREGPPRFFESLRLPFQRELHLFPQAPSSSEGGGCNRSSSELKPLRYKVGGPSEVCARFFVRDEPHGYGVAYSMLILLTGDEKAPIFPLV